MSAPGVISLNSEIYFGCRTDQDARAQEEWLRNDLRQHRTLCALAYFHRPLFSSGKYGSSGGVRSLWGILYPGGVDLVLNGHEHDYERFLPQTPTGLPDTARGIVQIISGTGGGTLRRIGYPVARNSAAQIQGRFGVLKLTLAMDSIPTPSSIPPAKSGTQAVNTVTEPRQKNRFNSGHKASTL
jgi:hypothetical protein